MEKWQENGRKGEKTRKLKNGERTGDNPPPALPSDPCVLEFCLPRLYTLISLYLLRLCSLYFDYQRSLCGGESDATMLTTFHKTSRNRVATPSEVVCATLQRVFRPQRSVALCYNHLLRVNKGICFSYHSILQCLLSLLKLLHQLSLRITVRVQRGHVISQHVHLLSDLFLDLISFDALTKSKQQNT